MKLHRISRNYFSKEVRAFAFLLTDSSYIVARTVYMGFGPF